MLALPDAQSSQKLPANFRSSLSAPHLGHIFFISLLG